MNLGYLTILSLLTAPPALLPAASPTPSDEGYTLRTDVRLVLLDVSVKDRSGAFANGLSKDSFSVYENGKRQSIKVFANEDSPVTVGILVDTSYSMTPKRNEVLTAAQLFIRESNSRDEVFVLNFNDRVRRGLPEGTLFSSNIRQLHDALYRGKPEGKTALNDAVLAGLEQLKSGRHSRRTLLIISDGGDNASVHGRNELIDRVQDSTATIYAIGAYEQGDPDRDPALLKRLARISGGEAYFPDSLAVLSDVCSHIAKDVRQRYTVGYTPGLQAAAGNSEVRQIRVRVTGPGDSKWNVRTRSSYRYEESKR